MPVSAPGALSLADCTASPGASEDPRVARARQGDGRALESLLAECEAGLFLLARRMTGTREDAEDCLQDAFLRAFRGMSRFDGRSSFRTWLTKIVVRTCLDRRRKPAGFAVEPAVSADTEEIALLRLELQELLGRLPAPRRAALLLREQVGFSVAEIGQAMGWSEKKVHNELYRARVFLAGLVHTQSRPTGSDGSDPS